MRMSADPVLVFEHVSRRYVGEPNSVAALDDVTLQIGAGEFVGLAGPSGSGKSTLIHLAAGLDAPTSGTVTLDGVDLGTLDDERLSALRRTAVGLIFQNFHLVDFLTAEENVALPLRLSGVPAADARDRVRSVLHQVGLAARLGHRPSQLSGGEMQRVAIARALVIRPRLLLADEPTGNLDSASAAGVLDLLYGLNRDLGVSLLLVTHAEVALARADRSLHLCDGRLTYDMPARALPVRS
jgi:putative ABC transport system ATP-binding protein